MTDIMGCALFTIAILIVMAIIYFAGHRNGYEVGYYDGFKNARKDSNDGK